VARTQKRPRRRFRECRKSSSSADCIALGCLPHPLSRPSQCWPCATWCRGPGAVEPGQAEVVVTLLAAGRTFLPGMDAGCGRRQCRAFQTRLGRDWSVRAGRRGSYAERFDAGEPAGIGIAPMSPFLAACCQAAAVAASKYRIASESDRRSNSHRRCRIAQKRPPRGRPSITREPAPATGPARSGHTARCRRPCCCCSARTDSCRG
jgi:hypothetical protein